MFADNIDFLRVISIFLVIVIHSASPVIINIPFTSIEWHIVNLLSSLARLAVPVFVMISGYLLLHESKYKESFSKFYKKRVVKILYPLIFWTLVFHFWTAIKKCIKDDMNFNSIIINLLDFSEWMYYHLWFLYMILFLYALTPIIRFVLFNYYNIIFFLVGFLFLINIYFLVSNLKLPFTLLFIQYLPYYIIGGMFIKYKFKIFSIFFTLIIFVGALSVTTAGSFYFISQYGNHAQYMYEPTSPFVAIMSLSLFIIFFKSKFQYLCNYQENIKKFSILSFGIYLIHPIVLELTRFFIKAENFFPWISVIVIAVIVFVVSAYLVNIFLQNKYLKRLVQ